MMNEFSLGKSTGSRYKYKNNKAFCLGLTFLKADLDENIPFGKNKKTEFLQWSSMAPTSEKIEKNSTLSASW